MSKQYGKEITPILKEISDSMWEIDARSDPEAYEFPDLVMVYSAKIMMNVMMDKMWANQEAVNTPLEERVANAENLGNQFRQLMLEHLGVDMHEEIKKELE